MAGIKLYYFSARLRAEFIRLTLHAAGQTFEDIYVTKSEWSSGKKAEAPFGQLPYMVYKGKKYAQSAAIGKFVAREFGLYGKTNMDALMIDQVIGLADDIKYKIVRDWYFNKDEEKKAEAKKRLQEEEFPKFLGFFENLLNENGSTGYFVGDSVTLADLVVYDIADSALVFDPEAIAAYPSLKKLRSNVEAIPAVKTYLDMRQSRKEI